jgi:hypothetical protein
MLLNITNEGFMFHAIACSTQKVICENLDRLFMRKPYDVGKGFKSALFIDKGGKATHTFSAGMHTIAVKIVDNEGLESIETVKLKINGGVEKL